MPVPKNITHANISGRYIFDTSPALCDISATENFLAIFGLPSKIVHLFLKEPVYVNLKNYKDANGVEYLDLDETLADGTLGAKGLRIFSGEEVACDDPILGPVFTKTRRVDTSELTGEQYSFVKGDCEADAQEVGVIEDIVTSNTAKSGRTWRLHIIIRFDETTAGRRLAWIVRVSGLKEAKAIDTAYYLDFVEPLKHPNAT